jgi:hypothetical protein
MSFLQHIKASPRLHVKMHQNFADTQKIPGRDDRLSTGRFRSRRDPQRPPGPHWPFLTWVCEDGAMVNRSDCYSPALYRLVDDFFLLVSRIPRKTVLDFDFSPPNSASASPRTRHARRSRRHSPARSCLPVFSACALLQRTRGPPANIGITSRSPRRTKHP